VVSGTTVRLASLVAAILGTSTYAFSRVYTAVPSVAREGVLAYARCEEVRRRQAPAPDLDMLTYAEANERVNLAASQCISAFERTQAAWLIAGLALLLAVAAALYLMAPWWIRRRRRLVPVTAAEFPQLTAALVELSKVAGLRRVPDFVLDPVAAAPGGLTYGRFGRYAVLLNAGLVPLRLTNPVVFQAIVLHELAHIRNRDVDLGYATVALWRSFVAMALLPMVVVTLHPAILSDPLSLPWSNEGYIGVTLDGVVRALLFVVIVYLTRNAVLRTRETYADARAAGAADARGESVREGLRRAVSAGRVSSADDTLVRRWRRLLGVHPDPQTRLRAIDDPTTLLRPGMGEMFAAGLTTVIAASTVAYLAGLGLPHTGTPAGRTVAIVIAPLTVAMLTAAAWRTELLSSLRARRVSVLPAALGFSLGWLLGDLAAITNSTVLWGVFGSLSAAGRLSYAGAVDIAGIGLGSGVISALLLVAGMACQAGVSAAGARGWLPTLRGNGTRWACAAGIVVTAIPFAVWCGIWFEVHGVPFIVGHLYHWSTADSVRLGVEFWEGPGFNELTTVYPPLAIFSARALAVPVVALAWVYPLAAYLVPVASERRPRIDMRYALLAGAGGAGAFAVLVVVARAGIRFFAPERAAAADFQTYFYFAAVGLAVLIQGVVGGLLAAGRRPLGLPLGLLAAAVTAVGSTAAFLAAQAIGGCVPALRLRSSDCGIAVDVPYTWRLLVAVLVKGALAALVVGALVQAVTAVGACVPTTLRSSSRRVRSAAVAGAVLVLLAVGYGVAGARYAVTEDVALRPPPGSTSDPSGLKGPDGPAGASPPGENSARVLTDAEVTAIARQITVGLPAYWVDRPPSPDNGNVTNPSACDSIVRDSYLTDIDAGKRASANVSLTNGGRLTVSLMSVTVSSYAGPVPASVFTTATTTTASCPHFSVTTPDGFRVDFEAHVGSPPQLGDQAARLDFRMSAQGAVSTNGQYVVVLVRIGHTLISMFMTAINEPLDEELFLAAVNRVVAAVPAT
jgi:Zn-dependent protease with chaperone function